MSRRLKLSLLLVAVGLLLTGRSLLAPSPPPVPVESRPGATAVQPRRLSLPSGERAPVAAEPTAPHDGAAAPRVAPERTILLTDLPRRDGDAAEIARALVAEHRVALGLDAMTGELQPERVIRGLAGRHMRWVQVVRDVPVFGSRVSAHVRHDGRPLMLRADVYPIRGITDDVASVTPRIGAGEAAASAVALLVDEDATDGATLPRVTSPPELMILPRGRDGRLAWHVGVRSATETLRVFVDASHGGVLRAEDARIAADGRGVVFDPNPVHTTGNGSLRDQDDRDQAVLTNAMELVTLPRLDGSGYLVGQWANLRDSPISTFSITLDWTWVRRSHHAFEQVNAYYHVDRVQAHLQALGLTNVNAEAQRIDAHAAEHDQSIYDIFDDRLEFGDGGVDDAEDADVVIHEYGHAIQYDQVGTFGVTGEGGAMGEGFGDFLAVVFHESGRPAWDPLFGAWDATSIVKRDPPYLRRVDRDKVFPRDYADQVHTDGEIWSRFLMDLRTLMGADDALRVVIESHFFLTPNSRFWQGCDAILVANIGVRDGRDDASIRALMDARGLPYTVPSAPLPEEESFEADSPEEAVTLAPGTYQRLLLADDDYVKVDVPPFRRVLVRVDHDAAAHDVDAAALDAQGVLAAVAEEPGGVEVLSLTAGSEPLTYTVRLYHPDSPLPGAYDLTVTETDLEAFGPTQTIVRDLEPGATWSFRVAVAPSKVEDGARLRIRTKKLRRGAKTDLQLFAPDGSEIVDVVTARRKKGGKAKVAVESVGDWIGVVRPRSEQRGPTKLKIKLK